MSGYKVILFNPNDYLGVKVKVYRNLHNGLMSVSSYIKGKGWRLLGHSSDLVLSDCSFIVNENGRQKVIASRQKNVHAFIIGEISNATDCFDENSMQLATYNPYLYGSFVLLESKKPLKNSNCCIIKQCKVFVKC